MSDDRPLPRRSIAGETEPYWEAAREERLLIQRCGACGEHVFPPRVACPYCLAPDPEWVESPGRGAVYTYSTIHHPPTPAWADAVPYTNGIVELEEGVYLFSQVVGCPAEAVEVGMPVCVTFDHATDGVVLPKFEPR